MPITVPAGAASRPTEKKQSVSTQTKATDVKRQRGRPAGSKNKPKGLLPVEVADKFLGTIKDKLTPEQYEQMRLAVREGKAIATLQQMKVMLQLMSPSLWMRLSKEGDVSSNTTGDPDLDAELGGSPEGEFRRDTNERMKIWMELAKLIVGIESKHDDSTGQGSKPILEIFARRGIDGGRARILIGVESSDMAGDVDGTERPTISVGAVPDTLPERQVYIQSGSQVPTIRVLDDNGGGDDPLSEHSQEL